MERAGGNGFPTASNDPVLRNEHRFRFDPAWVLAGAGPEYGSIEQCGNNRRDKILDLEEDLSCVDRIE
jgi:hypothetical protein